MLAPVKRADVAKLRPIEVVYVCREGDRVWLQTDTDDLGTGPDVMAALEDMKATSPALIYLDTAQFLLIGPGGEAAAQQLQGTLKRDVRVCATEEKLPLTDVAKYLKVHGKLPKLGSWKTGDALPVLQLENERIKIS